MSDLLHQTPECLGFCFFNLLYLRDNWLVAWFLKSSFVGFIKFVWKVCLPVFSRLSEERYYFFLAYFTEFASEMVSEVFFVESF